MVCSVCSEERPQADFPARGKKCRACLAAQQREYRRLNPERIRAHEKARHERDGDKRRASVAARYAQNRGQMQEESRARYAADAERISARNNAYRKAHPEKAAEYTRRYREKNPLMAITVTQNRRTRIGGRTVTKDELEALWTGACGICDAPIDAEVAFPHPLSRSLDHVVPLAKGGQHEVANLQWAHLTCNRRKSDKVA